MSEAEFGPWRKSSYSGDEGSCVELAWRRSSYSGDESNCVEMARTDRSVAIRDSKAPESGHLEIPVPSLRTLLKAV